MAFKTYYNLAPCYLYELILCFVLFQVFSYSITGLFFKCSVFLHFRALVVPSVGKIFHNQLYCLHLHFLPNLSSPFPIIILFPPILSSLVILFKSQPTPQHTLSPFPPCLLLVFVSVFLCFHNPPFRLCKRAWPRVSAPSTCSDLLN